MHTTQPPICPVRFGRPRPSARGVALVIVLGFLVLISALVVAFFSSVQTELTSAKSYAAGASVKQLSETTTNIVMSQISDATKTFEVPGSGATAGSGKRLTWASQPGLIHTYDDVGRPDKTFKLYSAWDMVDVSGSEFLASSKLGTEVPNNWFTLPARFTDLNAPVLVSDETNGNLTAPDGKKYFVSYPILDPDAKADGYTPGPAPGYVASTLPTDKPSANKVAMPVTWLYVLQNGTITSPAGVSGDGLTANWSNLGATSPNKPSVTNPIVGRIAFWTDDETSKVNVNTASEPTPWDTPRAFCLQDLKYGQYQPANQEFQRYPGHPASVALSPILFPSTTPGTPRILTTAEKESLYAIVPRTQPGGTKAATVAFNNVAGQKIITDSDRLFASMDEFLFDPARTIQPTIKVDAKSLFFLTATSRAPEVNMFGLPRISLWPVASTVAKQSVFDKLAAFCATLGDTAPTAPAASRFPFYFIRKDSTTSTADWGDTDMKRNQTLYSYLQSLTSRDIPGFGGNLNAKLTTDRDQVLTEIFDYIRCTNLRDPQWSTNQSNFFAAKGQVTPVVIGDTKGFGRFHTISQVGFHFICGQQGDKGVLTNINAANKLPAGERMVEAALIFEPFSPSIGFYKLTEEMYYTVNFLGTWSLDGQALSFPPSTSKNLNNGIGQGYHNNGREHGGTGGIRGPIAAFGGNNYSFVSTPMETQITTPAKRVIVGKAGKTVMDFSGGTVEIKVYAGSSAVANKLVQTFKVDINGGKLPLPEIVLTDTETYRGAGSTTKERWWTFKGFQGKNATGGGMRFPGRYENVLDVPHAAGQEYAQGSRRWDTEGGAPGFKIGGVFRREDVVRTMVPNHGDIRLVAASTTDVGLAGASQFVKVDSANWEAKYRFLHIFSNASGPHFHFGFCNEPTVDDKSPAAPIAGQGDVTIPPVAKDAQLTASADVFYHYSRLPEIRAGAGKQFNLWGDFDNGPAQWMDGAYINKPDEGNQNVTNSVGGTTYRYWSWNDDSGSDTQDAFFSPNRLVPSAGMLGSLPTGVKRNKPWQTLLFRPQKKSSRQWRHRQLSLHQTAGSSADGPFLDADH